MVCRMLATKVIMRALSCWSLKPVKGQQHFVGHSCTAEDTLTMSAQPILGVFILPFSKVLLSAGLRALLSSV